MTDTFPAPRTQSRCNFIRGISTNISLAAFLLAWPFVTSYVAVAWFLVDETAASQGVVAERLYFLGAFMLYAYPLVVIKVGASYAAIAVAVLSARLLPVLLAAVTWLSLKGLLPTGIVGWDGKAGWRDAVLYSILTILATALAVRTRPRGNQVCSINAPSRNSRFPNSQSPDT